MVQLSKAGLTDPSAQQHQMTYTQEGVQMHRPRGKIFLSKDTAGLPNGFIQRAEFFKANMYSQYPLREPGSGRSSRSRTRCLAGSCAHRSGRGLSATGSGGKHAATCLPVHSRQGLTSSWVICCGHANSQQQRGSAPALLARKSTCA